MGKGTASVSFKGRKGCRRLCLASQSLLRFAGDLGVPTFRSGSTGRPEGRTNARGGLLRARRLALSRSNDRRVREGGGETFGGD